MKNLLLTLSISFLFQSCFNYKIVTYDIITVEAIETKNRDLMNSLAKSTLPILSKREFKIKKIDGTNVQGKLVSKNGETISLKEYGKIQTITKKDIDTIKVRKFSTIKSSILFIPLIAIGLADIK
ncbi:hypothetical protein N9O83_02740 [Flavobacteriales bacterium]|nr:hypothetical protein [Flavobacteriales bacterium]